MKKLLLLALCAFIMSTNALAWELVPLTVKCDENKSVGNDRPRGPIDPPTVHIEDYVLTFEADHPDYVLHIKDIDGDVVYTTTVYSMMTLATLPSILSGEYELNLVPLSSTYYYIGYIEL